MTRREFLDSATTLDELAQLCIDLDIEIDGGSIIRGGDLDAYIYDDIDDLTRSWTWDEIRDSLNNIDENGNWFLRRRCLEYITMTEGNFDDILSDAIDYCDAIGLFDDDDEYEIEDESEAASPQQNSMDTDGFFFASGIGYDDVTGVEEDRSWIDSVDVKVMPLM